MYTNERRRVAQFCHIRRRQNRDNRLITNAPRSEIPAQITKKNRRLKNDRGSSFRFSDSGKVKINVFFFFSRVRYLKFSLIIFDLITLLHSAYYGWKLATC